MRDGASMPIPDAAPPDIIVGDYVVQPSLNQVTREGEPARLEPKVMHVLLCLIKHAGQVVSKEQLIRTVWPETFVTDQVLTNAVWQIRQALGRDSVQTISRGGYRLAAAVKALPSATAEKPVLVAAEPPVAAVTANRQSRIPLRWLLATVAVLVCVAGFAAYRYFSRPAGGAARQRLIIAVLPFTNLSGDPQQEYFSDGMTEEMILQLGLLHPERLGVIARASVMTYKHSEKRADQIAHELGADYILTGSVRRDGQRVRVTAQLVDARGQSQLWGQNYEQDWKDTLLLQSDIARSIARQINLELSPQQEARLSNPGNVNPVAYELFLKARYVIRETSPQAYQTAIETMQSATRLDPHFAAGFSFLAKLYVSRHSLYFVPPGANYEEAKAAAVKAVELDPNSGEAHDARAGVASEYEWDWATADREYRRALQLNPNNIVSRMCYSEYLTSIGDFNEALGQLQQAEALAPRSTTLPTFSAYAYFLARRYDASIAQARRSLEAQPDFYLPHHYLAWSLSEQHNLEAAIAEMGKAQAKLDMPDGRLELARLYAQTGRRAEAQQMVEDIEKHETRFFHLYYAGLAYAYLGQKELALNHLEEAYRRHERTMKMLKVDPRLDLLRNEPRFQELLRRMNFPAVASQAYWRDQRRPA